MFMSSSLSDSTMFGCPSMAAKPAMMEKRWKSSHPESAPNCPRCASSNTKFCYYNNYSLSQPRYFCKGCRRYWTKGGSLRNVPVGGGCRKSRKSKSARLADQRSGLSYQIPSPGSTSDESNSSSGVNIDLAAVFAKFLNQDSSSEAVDEVVNVNVADQETSSSGVSYNSLEFPPNSFDAESHELENMILECQKPYDFIDGAQIHEGLIPPLGMNNGDSSVQELVLQNCEALNLQAILGDEIGEGSHLLSDGTSLPNLEWQSIMPFQDFGSSPFSNDIDDMKIPSNFSADDESWSSFDLSGYEIFPRHWNFN